MGILISLWEDKVVHIKTLILHTISVVEDKISSPQSCNLCLSMSSLKQITQKTLSTCQCIADNISYRSVSTVLLCQRTEQCITIFNSDIDVHRLLYYNKNKL